MSARHLYTRHRYRDSSRFHQLVRKLYPPEIRSLCQVFQHVVLAYELGGDYRGVLRQAKATCPPGLQRTIYDHVLQRNDAAIRQLGYSLLDEYYPFPSYTTQESSHV